jgi:hypothetical protein
MLLLLLLAYAVPTTGWIPENKRSDTPKTITRRLLEEVLFAEQMMVDVAVDTQAFYMPTFNRVVGARLSLAMCSLHACM